MRGVLAVIFAVIFFWAYGHAMDAKTWPSLITWWIAAMASFSIGGWVTFARDREFRYVLTRDPRRHYSIWT